MKIIEPAVIHDFEGVMTGAEVKIGRKYFRDLKHIYGDPQAIDDDTLMYTVYSYETGDLKDRANLLWGMTVIEPVLVNGECNMTRGHFHCDTGCPEFYIGLKGEGLLLLMDEKGEMWAEKVFKGSVHHIDGRLAHRLVNTGDTEMRTAACWSPMAGHDYARMEAFPFPRRVYKENGELIIR
ncbi:MAG: glucose-6-phosphate isomerase [Erysipelotrichaceae bacterium]|nr:glucose-6-phosphate isomerase [Erysipelotrichaceae bacterium]MBO4537829.1 glucose-6-phosphate isomerase [Erysipelotrichaceae bacterium]